MSTGREYTFINYYIADGFAEDCEEIIQRFLRADDLSFEVFKEIFFNMKFYEIYNGRISKGEMAELTEEVLIIGKQFMLMPANSYEESIAGLFLLYMLVHTQPLEDFAAIRIIPEDVTDICRIIERARERQHDEALYVIGSLLIEGPTEFHIAQRPYGMERQFRKYFEDKISMANINVHQGVLFRHQEESKALRSLSAATKRYTAAKALISSSLNMHNYIDEDMPDSLQKELKMLLGLAGQQDTDGSETPPTSALDTKTSIRLRAMQSTVDGMKHLSSVTLTKAESPKGSLVKRNNSPPRGIKRPSAVLNTPKEPIIRGLPSIDAVFKIPATPKLKSPYKPKTGKTTPPKKTAQINNKALKMYPSKNKELPSSSKDGQSSKIEVKKENSEEKVETLDENVGFVRKYPQRRKRPSSKLLN